MHINADSSNSQVLHKHGEGGRSFFFSQQQHSLSLEETDALVRGQGEEREHQTDLSTLSSKCNGIHFQSSCANWTSHPSAMVRSYSGRVLNLLLRKDRVCLSGLLKQHAVGIPPGSVLNCQNLALVTSNKTLRIVYSNLWTRKSGFIWFFLFREAGLKCLPLYFYCFASAGM